MLTIAKRIVGALFALAGLALVVIGLWFATSLDSTGRATFTAAVNGPGPVTIGPEVLNRLTEPTVVTATDSKGGEVHLALVAPSDATALFESGQHRAIGTLHVRDWAAEVDTVGSGPAPDLSRAQVWRNQATGTGHAEITVEQRNAPEVLVVTGQHLDTVTIALTRKPWFVQAVVGALVGFFLLLAGLLLLWTSRGPRQRRRGRTVGSAEGATAASAAVDDTAVDDAAVDATAVDATAVDNADAAASSLAAPGSTVPVGVGDASGEALEGDTAGEAATGDTAGEAALGDTAGEAADETPESPEAPEGAAAGIPEEPVASPATPIDGEPEPDGVPGVEPSIEPETLPGPTPSPTGWVAGPPELPENDAPGAGLGWVPERPESAEEENR